jgi:hypothetical protein
MWIQSKETNYVYSRGGILGNRHKDIKNLKFTEINSLNLYEIIKWICIGGRTGSIARFCNSYKHLGAFWRSGGTLYAGEASP